MRSSILFSAADLAAVSGGAAPAVKPATPPGGSVDDGAGDASKGAAVKAANKRAADAVATFIQYARKSPRKPSDLTDSKAMDAYRDARDRYDAHAESLAQGLKSAKTYTGCGVWWLLFSGGKGNPDKRVKVQGTPAAQADQVYTLVLLRPGRCTGAAY